MFRLHIYYSCSSTIPESGQLCSQNASMRFVALLFCSQRFRCFKLIQILWGFYYNNGDNREQVFVSRWCATRNGFGFQCKMLWQVGFLVADQELGSTTFTTGSLREARRLAVFWSKASGVSVCSFVKNPRRFIWEVKTMVHDVHLFLHFICFWHVYIGHLITYLRLGGLCAGVGSIDLLRRRYLAMVAWHVYATI